ncbi:MAG: hypothetical protein R3D05_06115 [Dongiaceae bacterium]
MKPFLAAAALALAASAIQATPATADDVPCENMLKDLRAAITSVKPNDADAAKVKELEDKGIERCNADDDARADEFFAQAMKILGK